jgi:tetratricopeptide (TPR) repeat protein
VIGKVFWLGALGATEELLHPLEQKEFVQRARRSSVAGETEYAFRHVLIRDVAYGQIPRGERAHKHLAAAEWIESLGRPEDHAEMVAHHYVSALDLARAAGRDVDVVAARACVALREAGDRAMALNALPQAERYYADALTLAPDDPALLLRYGRVRFLRDEKGADELAAARDGLVAAGDPEAAAEAALMLANIVWKEGRGEELLPHLESARSLCAGRPPSRAQVSVLSELARYEMLADELDRAIELGEEALRLADELGLDDLRAHALNSVGSARGYSGDPRGFAELEESIAIAAQANSIADVLRGYNNLAAVGAAHADLAGSRTNWEECRRLAERFGQFGFVRYAEGGPLVGHCYWAGEWDEAFERANAFLAEVEAGSPHYQAPAAYTFRSLIRLGRDDLAGAEHDAARAVELARPIDSAQLVLTSLPRAAAAFLAVGNERRAEETLDEALESLRRFRRLGYAAIGLPDVARVGRAFGREATVLAVIEREPFQSPWLHIARAVATGDLLEAADGLGAIGNVSDQAYYRLRAAEQPVAEGRPTKADEQLGRALAFYRGVGATRYIHEGETLLTATPPKRLGSLPT